FSQWNVDGDWYIGIDPVYGIPSAKDTSERFYANSSESTLEIDGFFNFHGASDLSLEVLHSYHTEHGYDFCYVEIQQDGSSAWDEISAMSGIENMHVDRFDLSDYVNTYSRIRFRLSTDASIDDPGWWLGEMKLVSATAVDQQENELPAATTLGVSYPNPFYLNNGRSGVCKIDFALAVPGDIELAVYNLKGQKVCTLISETMFNGKHSVSWDGRNSKGKQAGSGIYFYQLKTESETLNRKMILIK
ncbi:MAG: T9SS type A sorting domain-containing protein, partial [Candidatus Stygibacter australis]|nr:T9SS type A sorting domain-containing protein [Candidatus Stygibacter australis]